MNDTRADERKTAVAWAVGSMKPARSGAMGYCASIWAISRDGGQTFSAVEPKVSKEPNRDEWRAVLKAIVGVLEDIEPGSAVIIRVVQERIPQNYRERWSGKKGKPHRDPEVAQEIFKLCDDKKIALSIVKHQKDPEYDALVKLTTAAVNERNSQLTPAERKAVPDMPGARPSFGPIDDTEGNLP